MYSDGSGHIAISTFALTLILGIGIGGAIGGTTAYIAADNAVLEGWEKVGATPGGILTGGALGSATVLGGAAGLASMGVAIEGFGLSTLGALGVATGVSATAGFASYGLNTLAYGKEFNWVDATKETFSYAAKGAINFGVAYWFGKRHIFDGLLGHSMLDIHNSLTIASYGSKFYCMLLGLESLVGPTLSKSILVSGTSFVIRWLFDLIFGF